MNTQGAVRTGHEPVQRRTLLVLVAMQIIGMIGVGAAPSVGILLASEVTGNEAIAGLARTSTTLGAALMGLPLGNLAARAGRRTALTLGWFVAAAGAALLVVAAQFHLVVPLFLGLFGIGAGTAAGLQSRFAATDLAPASAKARALSLVVWVGTLGSVLGPNLGVPGQWLGTQLGLTLFAGAFLIAAVCLAAAGLVVFAALRPDPLQTLAAATDAPVAPRAASGSRLAEALREVRGNPQARFALVALLISQSVMVAVMTMTPVHLTHLGDSVTLIGISISLHVAGMYVFAPLVGWCVDRFGARMTIGIGTGILAASCIVAAGWPHDSSWVVVSLVLLGVGWSFVNVAASSLFAVAVADAQRAQAQGGADALANLCAAVSAFAAGPLLAATNFTVLGVVALAVLVPLAWLTARRQGA